MEKKIKKLSIKVEKGVFDCIQPDEIDVQKITIKSNGQVWWSENRSLTKEEITYIF